jgi:hypothetical protein
MQDGEAPRWGAHNIALSRSSSSLAALGRGWVDLGGGMAGGG